MPNHIHPPAGIPSGRSNPLDEIRMAELHAAGLVEQAGQEAEARLAAARAEGEQRRQAARSAGRQAGQLARQQRLQAAEEEAARMQAASAADAQELRRKGQALLDQAAGWALGVVLGEIQAGLAPAGAVQPEETGQPGQAGGMNGACSNHAAAAGERGQTKESQP